MKYILNHYEISSCISIVVTELNDIEGTTTLDIHVENNYKRVVHLTEAHNSFENMIQYFRIF